MPFATDFDSRSIKTFVLKLSRNPISNISSEIRYRA